MRRRIRFWLAHLVPRRHVTTYTDGTGARAIAVWNQWGRRIWGHRIYPLAR